MRLVVFAQFGLAAALGRCRARPGAAVCRRRRTSRPSGRALPRASGIRRCGTTASRAAGGSFTQFSRSWSVRFSIACFSCSKSQASSCALKSGMVLQPVVQVGRRGIAAQVAPRHEAGDHEAVDVLRRRRGEWEIQRGNLLVPGGWRWTRWSRRGNRAESYSVKNTSSPRSSARMKSNTPWWPGPRPVISDTQAGGVSGLGVERSFERACPWRRSAGEKRHHRLTGGRPTLSFVQHREGGARPCR